jgi:ABC-type glycerol-3-phosphate transport system substrate-binding protein
MRDRRTAQRTASISAAARRAGSVAAAGLGLLPRSVAAQAAGPWATRPAGNPPPLTFVVWQYGKIYEQIGKQFEQDWSVKLNQIIEPNVEPQVAKLTAMYAAGDPVDVSQAPVQYLSSYIDQGIAAPIDGLPGVEQYVKDFTPFTRAIAQRRQGFKGACPVSRCGRCLQ